MTSIIGGTTGITFPDSTVQTTAATTPTAVANLSGGAAGVVPYQTGSGATSFTAAGTSGQVLTSAGTGTPTWSTPSAGAMTLISTQTASSSASLSWTGLSGYDKYCLIFKSLPTSYSNGSYGDTLQFQFGYGATPTYVGSQYNGVYQEYNSASNTAQTSGAGYINGVVGTIANGGVGSSGIINISGCNGSYVNIFSQTISPKFGGNYLINFTQVTNDFSTYTVTAFRIKYAGGNIVSGSASLYGISS
jgi:hypothetical protein